MRTIHELASEIEHRVEKDLAKACFPKDREYAGQLACAACPFNTGNQNVLFEGATAGKCTNGGCFTKKTNLFLKEFKEKAAKQFDGLKCVGMGSEGWNGLRQIKGAVVLSVEEAKSAQVKALVEKSPEKFGFAVVKPSIHGSKTPSAVLVCQDRELLDKKIRKPAENGERPLTQEEREREQFFQDAEVRALFAEGAKAVKSIKKRHLIDIVGACNGCEAAYEAVGVPASDDVKKALAKLSEKDLLRLAWLCSVDAYNLDEELAEVGVAVARVRKEARKAALAEWEHALKAKAAKPEEKEVAATK